MFQNLRLLEEATYWDYSQCPLHSRLFLARCFDKKTGEGICAKWPEFCKGPDSLAETYKKGPRKGQHKKAELCTAFEEIPEKKRVMVHRAEKPSGVNLNALRAHFGH